jgi:hypothetical protein
VVKIHYFEYGFTSPNQPKLGVDFMPFSKLQHGALITRDARTALLELKLLVDIAAEKIRAAECESVGIAIGRPQQENPLRTLRDAADALQSPNFEAAISLAKQKMQTAVNWHLEVQQT